MTRIAQSLDALHRNKQLDGIRKTNRFQVKVKDLKFLEGFNSRDYKHPDTQAHIRRLAEAYKAGSHVPAILVKVTDGEVFVIDGHCRTQGMQLAEAEGVDLGLQDVEQFTGSELEADAAVLTSNDSLKLKPLERAQKYSDMVNRGASTAEIAKMVGRSEQHVKDYMELHGMPDSIKKLIKDEVVSSSEALGQYREYGTKAAEIIQKALEDSGKKRVTKKDVDQAQGKRPSTRVKPRVVQQMVGHMRSLTTKLSIVERREDGSATVELSAEEVEAIMTMRESLPEEKKPDPESNDSKAQAEQPA